MNGSSCFKIGRMLNSYDRKGSKKKSNGLKSQTLPASHPPSSSKKKMDIFVQEPTELANEPLPLQFEEGRYTLPDVLDSHLLPLVVQYDGGAQAAPFNKMHFDLTQPLLLYKKRNIQKVSASSLHIQNDKYEDLGESLLIPEDYKGWFAVLQRLTGCAKADDTVPHFASVEEIANSNTEKFLIGGTKKISGLQILDRSEGQIKHEERYFFPGDTLTAEKVEFGEAKKRSRLFRKPKYIREKFLMCTDESDRDILLPFEQEGIFYQISHKAGKPVKNVMQMSDIVARKLTPRIIKLVFGRFPVTQCAFTGLMKAESSRIETSVIASTIVNKQNILMEIPLNNELYFRIAITNDELRHNTCYRNAKHFCAERASTYMRNIKLCFHFELRADCTQGLPNDFILKTPPPETCTPPGYVPFDGAIRELQKQDDKTADKSPADSVRHSDISDISEVSIRPGRCASTGRMSFCLGNSYLTVPMYDDATEKRNSGNNNTTSEMPCSTRQGSRMSFNGKLLDMEGGALQEEDETCESPTTEELPPPSACSNISSYVNLIDPPKGEANPEFPDYIPAEPSRRPSSQPPDSAPPPIPLSSSTSGVSSGSVSSINDDVGSKRASSGSCEYDVPKAESSGSSASSISRPTLNLEKPSPATATSDSGVAKSGVTRRPSTYQFSEGCVQARRGLADSGHVDLMEELGESRVGVDSPIYENIQSLMEICKKLDMEFGHDDEAGIDSSERRTRLQSDESATEISDNQNDHLKVCQDNVNNPVSNECVEPAGDNLKSNQYELDLLDEDVSQEDGDLSNTPQPKRAFKLSSTPEDGDSTPYQSCSTLSASPKSAHFESAYTDEENSSNEAQNVSDDAREQTLNEISNYVKDLKCTIDSDNDNDIKQHQLSDKDWSDSKEEHTEPHNDQCNEATVRDNDNPSTTQEAQVPSVEQTQTDMIFDIDDIGTGNFNKQCDSDDVGHKVSSDEALLETTDVDRNTDITNVTSVERSDIDTPSGGNPCMTTSFSEEDDSLSITSDDIDEGRQFEYPLRKVRHTKSSNSTNSDNSREFPSDPDELNRMSSADVRDHFKALGIRETSLRQIENLDVNGMVLGEVLNGERSLRDSMAGVNLIDLQKISMYIRGWRPQSE